MILDNPPVPLIEYDIIHFRHQTTTAHRQTLYHQHYYSLTYLHLVPPVPSGTSGDELSPSGTIAGSISRVTPVYIHRLQIFIQRILPCPHWSSNPPPATFWDPFQCQTSWSGCRKSQNVTNKSCSSGRYYAMQCQLTRSCHHFITTVLTTAL